MHGRVQQPVHALPDTYRAGALPAPQESIPLLRLSAVLLRLSDMIYSVDDSHVGATTSIDVPLRGRAGERAAVSAKLLEFRCGRRGAACGSECFSQRRRRPRGAKPGRRPCDRLAWRESE